MPLDLSAYNNGHPVGLPPLPPYSARAPSIRSFTSAAPSYHSALPAYHSLTPRPKLNSINASEPRTSIFNRPTGSLPTSHVRSNPNARAYHSIAARRAAQTNERDRNELIACGAERDPKKAVKVLVLRREEEEFGLGEDLGRRIRPLEDPELVGEMAAMQNRKERLRKEGMEILEREDRRWDWQLAEMADWPARDESWQKFKKNTEKKRSQRVRDIFGGWGGMLGRQSG